MKHWVLRLAAATLVVPASAFAQDEAPKRVDLSPRQAVQEGNRLLEAAEPQKAVELYQHAAKKAPDSREVAFDEGLALYQLGKYDEARQKFREAAAGKADALADDALYSEGTCYHAQALTNPEDPKTAISGLEAAMQRYQNVLANRPDHQAARDANYKAGMLWRQLKEKMQQQQQSQPSDQDKKKDDKNQKQQQQQPQDQQQDQNKKQKQQSEQKQESSQDQKQQQQQEKQSQDQQQQQAKQDDKNKESEQQAVQQQKEQVSREQAERKLREMMQAVRQRKKGRTEPVQLMRVKPVDKDW